MTLHPYTQHPRLLIQHLTQIAQTLHHRTPDALKGIVRRYDMSFNIYENKVFGVILFKHTNKFIIDWLY